MIFSRLLKHVSEQFKFNSSIKEGFFMYVFNHYIKFVENFANDNDKHNASDHFNCCIEKPHLSFLKDTNRGMSINIANSGLKVIGKESIKSLPIVAHSYGHGLVGDF